MKTEKNYLFKSKERGVECQIKASSGKRRLGFNNEHGLLRYTSFLVNSNMAHDDNFEEMGARMLVNIEDLQNKNTFFYDGWYVSMNDSEKERFDELLADIKERKELESQNKIVEIK